jgi:hypothetical protein
VVRVCLFGGHGNGAKPKVTRFRRAVRKRLRFQDKPSIAFYDGHRFRVILFNYCSDLVLCFSLSKKPDYHWSLGLPYEVQGTSVQGDIMLSMMLGMKFSD